MDLTSMELDPTTLLAGLLFGAIGFVAFRYGRKMELISPVVIGLALMVYPVFVRGPGWTVATGIALVAALWILRE